MLMSWDARRDYIIAGSPEETITFAATHWIQLAKRAIQKKGRFAVALSGGSTPKKIFESIPADSGIDFSKVWIFWSDERAVPPDHPDSNYHMAMEALKRLPLSPSQIFRMKAEKEIEKNALSYEKKIQKLLGKNLFDCVMLGVGEDGHTASLFPHTKGLESENRLVVANHIPQKNTYRMTFTFDCINQSELVVVYALGESKKFIVPKVLNAAIVSEFPASRVGTSERKATWLLDDKAAFNLK